MKRTSYSVPSEQPDNIVPGPVDMLLTIRRAAGILGILIVLGLLFWGCHTAFDVFQHVGAIVLNPESIKEPVTAIGETIDADKILIPMGDKAEDFIPVGKTIALITVIFLYGLWAWIPLQVIRVTSAILLKHGLR